jgi:chaperonin GroES
MELRTIQDKILVELIQPESKTKGGVLLTDFSADKPNTAKVILVGPGKTSKKKVLIPNTVQMGNVVLFDTSAGVPFKSEGKNYLILTENDILGILE